MFVNTEYIPTVIVLLTVEFLFIILYPILHRKLKIGEVCSVPFGKPDKESVSKIIESKERKKSRMEHYRRKEKESIVTTIKMKLIQIFTNQKTMI